MSWKGCGRREVAYLICASILCKSSKKQNLPLKQYTIGAMSGPCPCPCALTFSFLLSSVDAPSDHILGYPNRYRPVVTKEEADHFFSPNASIFVALEGNQIYN
jgi:hypothetical protein